jgi:hypothetical protein
MFYIDTSSLLKLLVPEPPMIQITVLWGMMPFLGITTTPSRM